MLALDFEELQLHGGELSGLGTLFLRLCWRFYFLFFLLRVSVFVLGGCHVIGASPSPGQGIGVA